jgi:hypothetical protein
MPSTGRSLTTGKGDLRESRAGSALRFSCHIWVSPLDAVRNEPQHPWTGQWCGSLSLTAPYGDTAHTTPKAAPVRRGISKTSAKDCRIAWFNTNEATDTLATQS